ncbi:MAG: flagellar biosynthesis anti-sigma factor FlgM [Deltaproteobacteria bacterium]|nr:flagellar biosynthesis anti-sigma factor FlgM [Deltaproteobacteria bacterium]
MKISGTKAGGVSGAKGSKASAKSAPKKSADKVDAVLSSLGSQAADAVEVTDHAATIDLIKSLVADTPDIRTGEVERIASQLRSGKFKIDFAKVAESFIKEVISSEISKKAKQR